MASNAVAPSPCPAGRLDRSVASSGLAAEESPPSSVVGVASVVVAGVGEPVGCLVNRFNLVKKFSWPLATFQISMQAA